MEIIIDSPQMGYVTDEELESVLRKSIDKNSLKKVLIIPPDFTRSNSGAGKITQIYYDLLSPNCHVDIMPAIGTHMPMSDWEKEVMFGNIIPKENFISHDWRKDIEKIGVIPGDFVRQVSDGLLDFSVNVEINRHLLDKSYDLIISIGQVIPHEIVGMANYSKNILVGCGGKDIIDKSHILGAVYDMERIMGRDLTPVRKVFDYAETNFLKNIPIMYVLTVTTTKDKNTDINGIFIGESRKAFERAAKLSQQINIDFVEKPLKKIVVYLDKNKFKSTWIGNKSIYRTRMAIEDGGELIILAPGVMQFGEDKNNDYIIRKYGYIGRHRILELLDMEAELKNNMSAAAHLIHGSSDGRFSITYAVAKLSRKEIEQVNFNYMPFEEAYNRYNPEKLKEGLNILPDGEEVYFISNPALGLWALKDRFY